MIWQNCANNLDVNVYLKFPDSKNINVQITTNGDQFYNGQNIGQSINFG